MINIILLYSIINQNVCIIIFGQHDLLATAEDVADMVVGTYLCTSWKLNPYFLFNSCFCYFFQ